MTVTATLVNTGDADGEMTVALLVDGGDAGTNRTIDVPAGESVTVNLTRTFAEPGQYSLSVGNTSAGVLMVTAPTPSPPDETPTAGQSPTAQNRTSTPSAETQWDRVTRSSTGTPTAQPLGFLPAVVALLAVAVLVRRRLR